MKLPANKFTLFAAAWFAAGIYALIFRESGNAPPPFPHFDKAAHFALFFAQIWLLAKAFIHDGLKIPYRGLLAFALLLLIVGHVGMTVVHQRQGEQILQRMM